jgi:hypothetical protein
LAQRTEKGDSSSQTSWPVHPPKNSQSGSCAKAVKVSVKVLAEERNGSSGGRSAAAHTKRNKKNKERLRVKRDLVGSGPSQDATGRGSTSGAPISTEETELFKFVRQKELCHSVRRKKKEEKKKELQGLHDELRREEKLKKRLHLGHLLMRRSQTCQRIMMEAQVKTRFALA